MKFKFSTILLLSIISTYSQVGIGTTTPRGALEINSNTTGVVFPQVTLTAANVALPVTNPNGGALLPGTLVWNNATSGATPNKVFPGLYYWDGAKWVNFTGQGSKDWSLTGNEGTIASTNFIGTTDNIALRFRTNNITTGILDHTKALTLFSYNSGTAITGVNNSGFGFSALRNTTSGEDNTAIGESSLKANTTGSRNTGVGSNTLEFSTTGNNNTIVGDGSGYRNESGSFNTAIGSPTLYSNKFGTGNTAVGAAALYFNTASNNTAVGRDSQYNLISGTYNSSLGVSSLFNNINGQYNNATGYQSLFNNSSGSYNVSAGHQSTWDNTTGNYNTALGTWAYSAFGAATTYTNSTALGHNAQINASNQVRIGNWDVTSIGGFANWTNISDVKFKKNIKENVVGLEFIKKLRPVTYNLDTEAIKKHFGIEKGINLEHDKQKEAIIQSGFIAQEVEKAANEVNYAFSGVDASNNTNGNYGLRYAEFVVPLVKSIQEQQIIIEKQNKQIELLNQRLEKIEQKR
jgi:hypothetical protein